MVRVSPIAKVAAAVGLAGPLVVLFAAVAGGVGWVSFEAAVQVLTLQWGWWLSIAGTALGAVALVISLKSVRRAWPWLVAGFVLPAATLAGFLWTKARADALPPVHETATNWDRPLSFSDAIFRARGPDAWPVEADPRLPGGMGDVRPAWAGYSGRRVAEINAEACPEARTVPRLVPVHRVVQALEAEGVRVVGQSPWRVEGTQESAWFGRARDVVVRIEPEATDVRVSERIGLIDLGDTCDLAVGLVRRMAD